MGIKKTADRLATSAEMQGRLRALAQNVRDVRMENGQTMSELAELVGVSMHTIYNVENARNWPALPVYLAICRELKVSKPPLT